MSQSDLIVGRSIIGINVRRSIDFVLIGILYVERFAPPIVSLGNDRLCLPDELVNQAQPRIALEQKLYYAK